jgi:hypothetical protein
MEFQLYFRQKYKLINSNSNEIAINFSIQNWTGTPFLFLYVIWKKGNRNDVIHSAIILFIGKPIEVNILSFHNP